MLSKILFVRKMPFMVKFIKHSMLHKTLMEFVFIRIDSYLFWRL